jgi:POT family proton-dependent oligopeptide transporter
VTTPPDTAEARPGVPLEHDRAFFGHPRGLSTLFFTELWERFSYYGTRALLILFMTGAPSSGGLGLDTPRAGAIYGLYTSMAYLACLPGGWVADRLLGQRRAVLYGGILIALGNVGLAIPSLASFYAGLTLIVFGTGLLKPNVSVIVGQLYGEKDARRDAGFSIFYMGINIGAGVAPLIGGWLGQRIDWHLGFAAAAVGMLLGLVQYVWGAKYLGEAGLRPAPATSPEALTLLRRRTVGITAGVAAVLALGAVGLWTGVLPYSAGEVAEAAGYLLLATVVVFFGWLFFAGDWTPDERKRLYAIGAFFVAAALFWSVFEQAGSTLNLFADRNTLNRIAGFEFPSSWYQVLNSAYIWVFAPVFAWLWLRLGSKEPGSPVKFALGLVFVGAGFAVLVPAAALTSQGTMVSPMWLAVTYLLHTFGELCLSPVGLSAMTKLAPARIVGLMMGVWFLASSVGNYIGGRLAGFYESLPLTKLFGVVGAFAVVAGLVMWASARPVSKMMGEVK